MTNPTILKKQISIDSACEIASIDNSVKKSILQRQDSGMGSSVYTKAPTTEFEVKSVTSEEPVKLQPEIKIVREQIDPMNWHYIRQKHLMQKWNKLAIEECHGEINLKKPESVNFILTHELFSLTDLMVFNDAWDDAAVYIDVDGARMTVRPPREFSVLCRLKHKVEIHYTCKFPFSDTDYQKYRKQYLSEAVPLSVKKKLNACDYEYILARHDEECTYERRVPCVNAKSSTLSGYHLRTAGYILEGTIKGIRPVGEINHHIEIDAMPALIPYRDTEVVEYQMLQDRDRIYQMRDGRIVVHSEKINMPSVGYEISYDKDINIRNLVKEEALHNEYVAFLDSTAKYDKLAELRQKIKDDMLDSSEGSSLLNLMERLKNQVADEIKEDQKAIGKCVGLAHNLKLLITIRKHFVGLKSELGEVTIKGNIHFPATYERISSCILSEYRANRKLFDSGSEIIKCFDHYSNYSCMPWTYGPRDKKVLPLSCDPNVWLTRPSKKKDVNGDLINHPNLVDLLKDMIMSIDNQIILTKDQIEKNHAVMIARKATTVDTIKEFHRVNDVLNEVMTARGKRLMKKEGMDYLARQKAYALANPDEVDWYMFDCQKRGVKFSNPYISYDYQFNPGLGLYTEIDILLERKAREEGEYRYGHNGNHL